MAALEVHSLDISYEDGEEAYTIGSNLNQDREQDTTDNGSLEIHVSTKQQASVLELACSVLGNLAKYEPSSTTITNN